MRYAHEIALMALGVLAGWAGALVIAPPPGPSRVARADTIVLGRIVAHEDRDIEVALPGSRQKATYRIAVLQVNETLRGSKNAKLLRVAFMPPPMPRPGQPVLRTGGGGRVNLDVGRDGLFMLSKQPGQDFYQQPMYFNIIAATDPNFEKEVKETRRTLKLLADPMAGLKSSSAEERFLTAALLLYQYRTAPPGSNKQEPIDAAESKLILKALADAKWTQPRRFGELNPQELFLQLGLTPEDGWRPPQRFTPPELAKLAQTWLREHSDTYRIKRFVTEQPSRTP